MNMIKLNLEEIRAYARKTRRVLDRLRINSLIYSADRPVYMKAVTDFFKYLKKHGYRTIGESEKGRCGQVVPITPEWLAEQKIKKTKLDRLRRKCRRTGNREDMVLFIRELAKGEV